MSPRSTIPCFEGSNPTNLGALQHMLPRARPTRAADIERGGHETLVGSSEVAGQANASTTLATCIAVSIRRRDPMILQFSIELSAANNCRAQLGAALLSFDALSIGLVRPCRDR
jgi:hypothetical protein